MKKMAHLTSLLCGVTLLGTLVLTGCASRDYNERAQTVIDRHFPDEFVLHDTGLGAGFLRDATFVHKNDPDFRIDINGANLEHCYENDCSSWLDEEYQHRKAGAGFLKSVYRVFNGCQIPVILFYNQTFDLMIELDVHDPKTRQHLQSCADPLKTEPFLQERNITLYIVQANPSAPMPTPSKIDWKATLPKSRQSDPKYSLTVSRDGVHVDALRLDIGSDFYYALNKKMADEARRIAVDLQANVPQVALVSTITIRPTHPHQMYAFVMACSQMAEWRCAKDDFAIGLAYDVHKDEFFAQKIIKSPNGQEIDYMALPKSF